MQFRTELQPAVSSSPISHQTPVVCVGSCFAERIGARLSAGKFPILVNPFGVIFNPISLFTLLRLACERQNLPEGYLQRDGLWFHYLAHSQCWAETKESLVLQMNERLELTYEQLRQAKFLFITLGTAWVYALRASGDLVANCHKQPAHLFEKRLLQVGEIVDSFRALQASLQVLNPDLQVILTVSPVRHLKDTLELNSVGKAVLRLATYELRQETGYFPAYELLLDDLRDYRFYAPDLLHPNELGEAYIWEKFAQTYFRPETVALCRQVERVQAGLAHRPLQGGASYQKFLLSLQKDIEALPAYLDMGAERKALSQKLHDNSTKID